jgi:hypothetical protein
MRVGIRVGIRVKGHLGAAGEGALGLGLGLGLGMGLVRVRVGVGVRVRDRVRVRVKGHLGAAGEGALGLGLRLGLRLGFGFGLRVTSVRPARVRPESDRACGAAAAWRRAPSAQP